MKRGPLSVRHLEGILDAMRDVAGCRDIESFRLGVAASVRDFIGADLCHLMDADLRKGSIDLRNTHRRARIGLALVFLLAAKLIDWRDRCTPDPLAATEQRAVTLAASYA